MDQWILVDVDLIASIIGLPLAWVNPILFVVRKEQDPGLVRKMKEKYNPARDNMAFSIASINETTIWFAK